MSDVENALETLSAEIANLRARVAITDEMMGHLREIYTVAWIECCYDSYNEKSYEAAHQIYPHIKALNDELGFKK